MEVNKRRKELSAGSLVECFGENGEYVKLSDWQKQYDAKKALESKLKNMKLKMHHFNPNSYGTEYFVMSRNKNAAHQAILTYLKKEASKEILLYPKSINERRDWWISAKGYPGKYTCDEYGEDEVLTSELS